MRKLLETRRTVPLDRIEEYGWAWQQVVAAVRAMGGRAWLFRRAGHDDQFVEFVEWEGDPPVDAVEQVLAARRELELSGHGPTLELEEARL